MLIVFCVERPSEEGATLGWGIEQNSFHTLEFFIEVEDAVGDSEFQKLDEFVCKDLPDIGETGAGRTFGIVNL